MDNILKDAISRRDTALADARRWDEFVRMYSELRGVNINPLTDGPGENSTPTSNAQARLDATRRKSRVAASGGALQETEELALQVIRELGRPIPTRELLVELASRGLTVGGKDAASTLSARLSRAPKLENVRPEGWRERRKADGDVFE